MLVLWDSTCNSTRWRHRVVMRSRNSSTRSFQFPQQPVYTLWWATELPSEMPSCASNTQCIFTYWLSTSTWLKSWSITWRIILRSFIITRIFSVNWVPVNLHRRFCKPRKSCLLWTNRRNWRVARLRMIFLQLQCIAILLKIQCRSCH
jgi:hypothetical protein